ncbi:MAG: peptidoglycan DD-metalloendopeptidase family protein [Betaproteobacteria bacterium]|nr:peptidoglycan DD-metalloendopeptidase family protein [Betaproteobacteria bacterium]
MKNRASNVNLRNLRIVGITLIFAAALMLAGCASRSPAPVVDRSGQTASGAEAAQPGKDLYTVKRGDTLRSIAQAHGIDFRDLIAWNGIDNPNRIQPGVTLRVKPAGSSGGSVAGTGGDVAVARPIALAPTVENRSLDSAPVAAPTVAAPVTPGSNTATFKREPKGGKEVYSDAALAHAQGQARTGDPAPAAAAAVKPEAKPEAAPAAVPPLPGTPAPAAGEDDVAWMWPSNGKIVGTFSEGGSKGVDIAGKAGDPVLASGEGKVVYSGTGLRGYGKLVIVKHNATYLSAYAHNQNVLVKEGQNVAKGQKIAEMGNTDADQVKLHFEVRRQGKPVDPLKYLPPR